MTAGAGQGCAALADGTLELLEMEVRASVSLLGEGSSVGESSTLMQRSSSPVRVRSPQEGTDTRLKSG